MQAMKGATVALGSMNKSMNLPALQRIAMEFERENDVMEQRQEMMDDAIDDAMDVGLEEEGDEVVEQVLEEIGVDLNQAVSNPERTIYSLQAFNIVLAVRRDPDRVAIRQSCRGQQSCSSSWWWRRRGSCCRRSSSPAR
jgi:division protein CdvB (Snf7/Vps24/ESCRT-III family)